MNKINLFISVLGTVSLVSLILFFAITTVPEMSALVENITGIPMVFDNNTNKYQEIITPYHTNETVIQ
jgi:hypothetical protein